jgi:hypothetical protein
MVAMKERFRGVLTSLSDMAQLLSRTEKEGNPGPPQIQELLIGQRACQLPWHPESRAEITWLLY